MRLPRAERRAMRLFYPAVSRFPGGPDRRVTSLRVDSRGACLM